MPDRRFLILNDRWSLAFNAEQWIIQNKVGTEWRSISFVATKKSILRSLLAEKGVTPTPDAEHALRCLPSSFKDWYANFQYLEVAK